MYVVLNNNIKMPKIGFGTYIPTNKTEEAVLNAL